MRAIAMSKLNKDEVTKMLTNFVESLEQENMEEVKKTFPDYLLLEYKNAFDTDKGMYSSFVKSKENGILMNIMDKEDLSKRELKLFYSYYDFIRNHIKTIVKMKEGSSCSSDKAGWVLINLEHYLKTGESIEPDYSQEYTYHLPKIVLNDTNTIYKFFKSLISLYYGNSKEYFLMYNQFIIK